MPNGNTIFIFNANVCLM